MICGILLLHPVIAAQKKETLYVCELCRKHGKEGEVISQFQSSKSKVVLPQSELEIGSQQLLWSNGKVCVNSSITSCCAKNIWI